MGSAVFSSVSEIHKGWSLQACLGSSAGQSWCLSFEKKQVEEGGETEENAWVVSDMGYGCNLWTELQNEFHFLQSCLTRAESWEVEKK